MRRPEQSLHLAVVQLLHVALPRDAFFFHPANGGARTKAEAGILKAMGVRAGTPDLCIIYRGWASFIELKAPNGKLSAAQLDALAELQRAGAEVAVCRSIEEVMETLIQWRIPVKASLVGKRAA